MLRYHFEDCFVDILVVRKELFSGDKSLMPFLILGNEGKRMNRQICSPFSVRRNNLLCIDFSGVPSICHLAMNFSAT